MGKFAGKVNFNRSLDRASFSRARACTLQRSYYSMNDRTHSCGLFLTNMGSASRQALDHVSCEFHRLLCLLFSCRDENLCEHGTFTFRNLSSTTSPIPYESSRKDRSPCPRPTPLSPLPSPLSSLQRPQVQRLLQRVQRRLLLHHLHHQTARRRAC